MQIAKAAIAPLGQQHALAEFGHVGDHGFAVLVQHLGANRHAQHDIVAILAGARLPHAGAAIACKEMLLIAKIDQRVQPVHGLDPDIATTPAIAAIGAAIFDIFLAPEADAAIAASTGAYRYLGQIEKFHYGPLCPNCISEGAGSFNHPRRAIHV